MSSGIGTAGIFDAVEEVEGIEPDTPAVVESIADPAVEDAGRRRAERIILSDALS
jgi:hypothetical protein